MAQHYLTVDHQNAIVNFVRCVTIEETTEHADRTLGKEIGAAPILTTSISATTADQANDSMQEVYEMINVLAGGIQALNDDTQRLSTESIRMQSALDSVTQEISSLKLSVQEQGIFLDGIKPNQDILHQDVASLKQIIDDLDHVPYDGTLIWKIPSFREKMSMLSEDRQRLIVERLICSGCPIRATNIHLFSTLLLLADWIQDARSSLPAWRWQCTTHTHVPIFRAHAWSE